MSEVESLEPLPAEYIAPVTHTEIADTIKYKIKPKKAPGIDLVTGEMLKNLPSLALKKLADIYNAALKLRWVPSVWIRAEVILIPKSMKPPELASSYRPISLLPIIGKLFERLYLKRLLPIIEERNLIPSHQFGFRKRHSTVEQIHRLVDIIEKSFEDRIVYSIAYLDVAAAFDRLWSDALFLKIHKSFPSNHFKILSNYLSNRSFRVRHEGCLSKFEPILAGVPQGSVLGPILFLLYMADFPKRKGTRFATFADDTAIASIGVSSASANVTLQKSLNASKKYCDKWKTLMNGSKSQHCTYAKTRGPCTPVYYDGSVVPPTKAANYLGMILDSGLTFEKHVDRKKTQTETKFSKMWWILRPGSGM